MRIVFFTYCFGDSSGHAQIGVYKRGLRVALELHARGHEVLFDCTGRTTYHDELTALAEERIEFVDLRLDLVQADGFEPSRLRARQALADCRPDLLSSARRRRSAPWSRRRSAPWSSAFRSRCSTTRPPARRARLLAETRRDDGRRRSHRPDLHADAKTAAVRPAGTTVRHERSRQDSGAARDAAAARRRARLRARLRPQGRAPGAGLARAPRRTRDAVPVPLETSRRARADGFRPAGRHASPRARVRPASGPWPCSDCSSCRGLAVVKCGFDGGPPSASRFAHR